MARTILVQILGDASSLEREFAKAGRASDTFGKRMGVSMKTFGKAGAVGAAVGGVALLSSQLKKSVSAAKDAEAAEARLAGAFDQAKVSAKEREQAQKAINRVSKAAALDDEDLSDVLAKLTRTTGSAKKGMEGMALAANIARARNIKLEAAAKIVEKAHVGQLRGLKAVGVEIGKNTTTTQALEKAQRTFAGSAERYGNTTAGAQEKLSVAFENLQERVGAKLLPVLAKLATWGVRFIDWSDKNWPRFSKTIKDLYAVIRPVVENITKVIQSIADVVLGVVRTIVAVKNGDWSGVWKGLKQVAIDGLLGIVKAATELPRKIVAALAGKAWDGLKAIGTTIKNAALGGLKGLADAMVGALQNILNKIIRLVNKAISAYNKIPVAPDIPKISEVGGGGGRRGVGPGSSRSVAVPRGQETVLPRERFESRRTSGVPSGPAEVVLSVDGRELGRAVLGRTQRAGKETAASRRGPFAGQRLALS